MSDNQETLSSSREGCVFCEIIAGESPASVFYEDDLVLGLMDTNPVTTGHAMIIPVHMHVLPRYPGDGFKLVADWGARPSRDELDRVAAEIERAY